MWTSEKPTKPCACAYESPGVGLFVGIATNMHRGFRFIGYSMLRGGGFQSGDWPVCEMDGHWLILDIPDPPKRMTPGEFVWKETRKKHSWSLWGNLPPEERATFNEAVTAAIAAARRGELLIEGGE